MSKVLKETMADEFEIVAKREGDPEMLSRIADDTTAGTVEELLSWMEEHNHPALTADPMF